ncbi:hypothetical protein, partial [uncultured Endozoicomonas sp.]|uniref:hypothetical protein n=1 Tax=uncultured Endozoicomonas sp. TaxID=432652 RepID=UPI002607308E
VRAVFFYLLCTSCSCEASGKSGNCWGILWRKITSWLEFFWTINTSCLKFDHSYHIFIDGKPMVPESANISFHADFISTSEKNAGIYQGNQTFDSADLLRVSLYNWLDINKELVFDVSSNEGELIIWFKDNNGRTSTLHIYRGYADQASIKLKAPWPKKHRLVLKKIVEKIFMEKEMRPISVISLDVKNGYFEIEEEDIPVLTPSLG